MLPQKNIKRSRSILPKVHIGVCRFQLNTVRAAPRKLLGLLISEVDSGKVGCKLDLNVSF